MTEIIRTPVFIDIEASGLTGGVPIEIGWASIEENDEVRSESHIIKPPSDWNIADNWDDDAADLHGISMEQLMQDGRSPHEITQRMNAALRGRSIFSDSVFDKHWLTILYDATPFSPTFTVHEMLSDVLVTKVGLTKGLTPDQVLLLIDDRDEWDQPVHRAQSDARHWASVWLKLNRR